MLDDNMFIEIPLSAGEWERILRARDERSQAERARDLKVSRWAYQKWEQDSSMLSSKMITGLEWCRLQRWRSGLSQENLASALGITRIWLNRMENGLVSNNELLEYWEFNNKKIDGQFKVVVTDGRGA
jgi:DNA-binding XRE family transcriptional regulator